jgi:pseudouridine synthase
MDEIFFGAEGAEGAEGGQIRLAKLMARRGLCSRRDAEAWIAEGRVMVDGEVVTTPVSVDPKTQVIKVDGKRLPEEPRHVYLLMYKPRGYITGRDDPEGRPSVHDLLGDLNVRVEPVGRLDFDTEGALLLTNDGDLAHKLTHPSTHVPKRYLVKVWRRPTDEQLAAIEKGEIFLDDGRVQPAKVRVVEATGKENCWIEITVTEGRNRLIRRLFAQIKHPVSKLRRISFATLSLRELARGEVRALTATEVRRLQDLADGVRPERAGKVKYKPGFARPKEDRRPRKSKGLRKTGLPAGRK